MKITHTPSGLPYHLKPGTQLEVERTNLFFNEWGEQTLPVELPDTDRNRQLTGYPVLLGNNKKPSSTIAVTIEDGEYFMSCRQAVLAAQRQSSISTTFYMNEGSFLSRISNTSLSDVFGDETISGITTVQQGINFCRSLINGSNPHFTIFPVLLDSEESYNNGYPKYKFINRYGYFDEYNWWHDRVQANANPDFYNAVTRSETIGDQVITLTPGYYISPFVRANYLLERLFLHFGYTLKDNFFTRTTPFPDMVFVNNCADALVNGTIRLVNLLPDCMCSTILNVFRKKFCCEFIPDEVNRIVDIKLFNETISTIPQYDLTNYLTSHPQIDFPEAYQQLIISSEEQVSDSDSPEPPDSISDLVSRYPSVTLDSYDCNFYRIGYTFGGFFMWTEPSIRTVSDKVAPSSMRYYAGGTLKTKEIKVPDLQPEFRKIYGTANNPDGYGDLASHEEIFLYIGTPNFLNSKLIVSGKSEDAQANADTKSDNTGLKPILAFFYIDKKYPRGTISNYGGYEGDSIVTIKPRRLSDYTLCYNGEDSIFERFYRPIDEMYRNSLHEVKATLLLPDEFKQSLHAHLPVLLQGQKVLLNKFKYIIGGKNEPIETELLTCNLYEPISTAKQFTDYISNGGHGWIPKCSTKGVSQQEYMSSPYKDAKFEIIFPQRPSTELAIPEKKYYIQKSCLPVGIVGGGGTFLEVNLWLECY